MSFSLLTLSPRKKNKEKMEKQHEELIQKYNDLTKSYKELAHAYENTVQQNKELIERLTSVETKINKIPAATSSEQIKATPADVEFKTDSDSGNLAEETEWIRVRNKKKILKKRKANSSLEESPDQVVVKPPSEPPKKIKAVPQPPPIMVNGRDNINDLRKIILEKIPTENFIMKIVGHEKSTKIKITTRQDTHYQEVTRVLNENHMEWHSYENKQSRPIRVMAKNLHHSCDPEEIKEDLKSQGLKIQSAINKKGWKSKAPLDMFILTFSNEEEIKKVYEIKAILNMKVTIEPLKLSKLIPQCKRCQGYGHTQKYCAREPRCVKCAEKHLSSECPLQQSETPKCIHCGEDHVASWRGCTIAIELQKLKAKQSKQTASLRNANRTYAQVVESENNLKKDDKSSDISQTLNLILKKLNSFDERLKKLELKSNSA